MSDGERYMTAEQAAERLGVSERSVYRYADYEGGRLRTRKASRRTLFHEGDVQTLADDLGVQRQGPSPDEVQTLRNRLEAAAGRIGYLEAQLERRLLPDAELQMRDQLAAERARAAALDQQLRQVLAQQQGDRRVRTSLLIGFVLVLVIAAVLVTLLVTGVR